MEMLLIEMVSKYPMASSFFLIIGILRAVFKPLQGVIDAYVSATPSPDDDSKWSQVKNSKSFKYVAWFLDYTASIKILKP